jgi:hypothetical protein
MLAENGVEGVFWLKNCFKVADLSFGRESTCGPSKMRLGGGFI